MIRQLLFRKIASWRGPRAQPTLDAPSFLFEAYRTALDRLLETAVDAGRREERKRIAEVLNAPGVASYPLLAFELAIDGASVAQVSAVIARTEVAVQARIHPTESRESTAAPVLH